MNATLAYMLKAIGRLLKLAEGKEDADTYKVRFFLLRKKGEPNFAVYVSFYQGRADFSFSVDNPPNAIPHSKRWDAAFYFELPEGVSREISIEMLFSELEVLAYAMSQGRVTPSKVLGSRNPHEWVDDINLVWAYVINLELNPRPYDE